MSNYTKSTNFATKDNLPTGDPLKIVKGTEIDTEFNNIATAVSTKTDNASAAITGGSITGITDLAIADGGTGASTATAAINNLLPSQTSNANKYLQTDGTNVSWDAVSLSTSDITGTLPIANGGTGTTSTTFVNLASNVTGTLPVANGGTGVTSSTGTGNNVLSDSPTLVTPALGTPSSAVLTNATGLPISTGVSGLGTGVATALGINTPNIGAIVVNGGALGTPSSGTVTNLTGTASININGTVGSSTAYSGAFTSLTTSSTVTINGGTANGIGYLNGSKVFTTGTVLKFDGTNFTSDRSASTIYSGTNQATWANGIVLNNSATPATGIFDSIYFSNNANMQNVFGVAQNSSGYGDFVWAGYAGTYTEWMKLTSAGLSITGTLSASSTATLNTLSSSGATLTGGTINGMTIGATTASTGNFTTLTTSSTVTLNGGTANGVTYLNGSKVLTSGSALTFDGSNLAVTGGLITATKGSANGITIGDVATNSNSVLRLQGTSAGYNWQIANNLNVAGIEFTPSTATGGTTYTTPAMALTSTGLGIGTSSPAQKFVVSNGGAAGVEVSPSGGSQGGTYIQSYNRSGSAFVANEFIASKIGFYTGTSPTLSALLDSSGNLLVGTTSNSATAGIVHAQSATNSTAVGAYAKGTTSSAVGYYCKVDSSSALYAYWNCNGVNTGTISTNGTTTSYNITSDYRLKTVVGAITGHGERIDALEPIEFTWNSNGSRTRGFLAHKFQEVYADSVTGTKDAVDENGNPVYQTMQASTSEVIADLVAEIKSLRQRVAQLETN